MLPDWTILLIVLRENIINKCIFFNNLLYGQYVKTRADNSGYRNHRVICLVVIGSSFDSEQVCQVSNGYL
jgi:hypothetical protein